MNENEAKKVELTDDLLEQVSGGSVTNKYKVVCSACGCLGTGLTLDAAIQMTQEHNNSHRKDRYSSSDWDYSELIHCRYQLDFD